MFRVEALIESLEKFKDECYQEEDFKELLFKLCFYVGEKRSIEPSLDKLKERLEYLIQKEGVSESFLVYSLVNQIGVELNNVIRNLGHAIITNEGILKDAPEDSKIRHRLIQILERLKDKAYVIKAEHNIDAWNKIKSSIFTLSNEREWYYHEFKEMSKKTDEWYKKLPEEYKGLTIGELKKQGLL